MKKMRKNELCYGLTRFAFWSTRFSVAAIGAAEAAEALADASETAEGLAAAGALAAEVGPAVAAGAETITAISALDDILAL